MAKGENIRNVVFASQGSSGKSSLIATILKNLKVGDKFPPKTEIFKFCDYTPEELDRGFTIINKVFTFSYKGYLFNFLDTPGYPDFLGEVISGIHASEGAVMVLDASSGIEVQTERVWNLIRDRNLPCLVFINKLDKEGADFSKILQELKNKFKHDFLPLYLPWLENGKVKDLYSVLTRKGRGKEEIPSSLKEEGEKLREKIIEMAAESEDALIEKYLEEGELSAEEIRQGLKEVMKQGKVALVIPGSTWEEKGWEELLHALIDYFPSPLERKVKTVKGEELEVREGGKFIAQVFKSTFEPHLGDMSIFRVFSGEITSGSEVLNSTQDKTEKVGQLLTLQGKMRKEASKLGVGEIGAVLKLKETKSGDTLCSLESPVILEKLEFPTPIFSLAIRPKERKDEEKISYALTKICQEDPTLRVEVNHEFGQTILSGMGELQLNLNIQKLSRYGVNVNIEEPRVPYRETVKGVSKAQGKYKRQTGGRGQYGDAWIELSPLERGKGFEFVNKIVGGAIPARFIPAVEKGIREAMKKGPLAGYPVIDVKVTLYDGSFHPVDSSDIAFQIAGSLAFKNAYVKAQPVLLEPIMKMEIRTPEDYVGDITGDLNARRGKIISMETEGEMRIIKALVPLAEVFRYATDLKSMTQGRGIFSMEFSHYEEVPAHISKKIIEEASKEEK